MKTKLIVSSALVVSLSMVAVGCGSQSVSNNTTNSNQEESVNANVASKITKQAGLILSFPTADLPLIDKKTVLTSQRNDGANGRVIHQAEYISDTAVSDLYPKYKTILTEAGWVDQKPTDQTVGSIQLMGGTYVKDGSQIGIAVETAVGTDKNLGQTKVLLIIDQPK